MSNGAEGKLNPKDFYKERHPDEFSDTVVLKETSLDRDFFSYYLSTVTSRSQEKNFEVFCRRLLEVEICPNLILQTGPTGGGDSKVDTETYPVSEEIALTWLAGYSDNAHTERWAFAISAKAEWKPKIRSDIKGIMSVNDTRNYSRIYFLSNQNISDKKRAEMQSELKGKYNIDVWIFDKNWIIDKTFKSDEIKRIAVQEFGLSESFLDTKKIGEKDYKRTNELQEINNKLKQIENMKPAEIIRVCVDNIVLVRELESPKDELIHVIDRSIRLSKKYGSQLEQSRILYEAAKSVYWWQTDSELYYDYYIQFEKIAVEMATPQIFEDLITLWMNLFRLTCDYDNSIDINKHRDVIQRMYKQLTADETKPHQILEARTAFAPMRIFLGASKEEVVAEYIDIIQRSKYSLEISLEHIERMTIESGLYNDASNYDDLMELLIKQLSEEKHDIEASRLLAKQAHAKKENDPYKAIEYYGRAILGFYNESSVDFLVTAVFDLAEIYEKIGLYWAARNYYCYVMVHFMNSYVKHGETSVLFQLAANRLKYLELFQGRFLYSTEIYRIENVAKAIFPHDIEDYEDHYDIYLMFPILKADFKSLVAANKLPGYLDSINLLFSKFAYEYEVGHYDSDLLDEFEGDKTKVDSFFENLYNQPAMDQIRFDTWFGNTDRHCIESRVCGCRFIANVDNDAYAFEFATSLLASIECFFGSSFSKDIYIMASSFEFDIQVIDHDGYQFQIEYDKAKPTSMVINLGKYNDNEFIDVQNKITEDIVSIIAHVISAVIHSNETLEKLKSIIVNENTLLRTELFANSLIYFYSAFGDHYFDYELLTQNYEEMIPNINEKISHSTCQDESKDDAAESHKNIIFDVPPNYNKTTVSNNNVRMVPLINVPLWNVASWRGTAYSIDKNSIPIIGLVFPDEAGLRIFQEWQRNTDYDVSKMLGVRIITEINKNHCYWYRVVIGLNDYFSALSKNKEEIIVSPVRLHTMQPQDNKNLIMFEQITKENEFFMLCPFVIGKGFVLNHSIKISKRNLRILKASTVKEDDLLSEEGIMPFDDPIIPDGYEDCDIMRILHRKQKK